MATVHTTVGDVNIIGAINATGTSNIPLPRSSLILETASIFEMPASDWRIWDDFDTGLSTAAGDDLGLFTGTYGAGFPYIRTLDLNASGGPNNYRARILVPVPYEYEIGQQFRFRVWAGMLTAVAGTSATVDIEAFQCGTDSTSVVGSDLVTTGAQDINSLAIGSFDFLANGTATGNMLDVRMTVTTTSATASSHFAIIPRVWALFPTRG